jgi:uncharacterized protein
MSDNVEMVRGVYEAFGRGDIPAVMENFTDDIEWHVPEPLPQAGDAHGPEEVVQFFQRLGDIWSGFQVEADDIVASCDRVYVIGRASGEVDGTQTGYGFVHCWTVSDGSLSRFDEYVDPGPDLLAR